MATAQPTDPHQLVVEESYVLAPNTTSRKNLEAAIRASRTTPFTDHLADDERPWADHLTPADRQKLSDYLAAHPEKVPAHLAVHLAHVGITAPTAGGAGPQDASPESRQP